MKIRKIAYRKRCEDQFEYDEEIRDMWRELLHKEKDRVHVSFDLENDDGFETKTKELDYKNKNDDMFRVQARICWAGGDWESPICYFKCQFQERTFFERDNSWGRWKDCIKAVIIPVDSNPNLVASEKKDLMVAKSGEEGVGSKDLKEKALWDEMQKLANIRVGMFYDEYKKDLGNFGYNNVASVRSLLEAYRS